MSIVGQDDIKINALKKNLSNAFPWKFRFDEENPYDEDYLLFDKDIVMVIRWEIHWECIGKIQLAHK